MTHIKNIYYLTVRDLLKGSAFDLYTTLIRPSKHPVFIVLLTCSLLLSALSQLMNEFFYFYPHTHQIFSPAYLKVFLVLSLIRTSIKTIHPQTSQCLFFLSLIFLLLSLSNFVINGIIITPFPLIDKYLQLSDKTFNFNILPLLIFIQQHQYLNVISWNIYLSLIILFFIIPLILFIINHQKEAFEFLNHLLLSVLIAGLFYYFFPSTGPATLLKSPYFTELQKYIFKGFQEIHTFFQTPTRPYPFLSAPSIHTIWALLLAYACRKVKYLNLFISIWALLVILTTLTTGWHFLTDIILAIGVTGAIILFEKQIDKLFIEI